VLPLEGWAPMRLDQRSVTFSARPRDLRMVVTELPVPGAGFVLISRPDWRSCRQEGLQQAVCSPDQPRTRQFERLRRRV